MPASYQDLPGFEHVYLEDSWVLDIEAHPGVVTVRMEAHLLPDHPQHRAPLPGQWACYRKATLVFHEVRDLHWTGQGTSTSTDPDGSQDFGNIDSLSNTTDGYHLEGSWGDMAITSAAPILLIHADPLDPNETPRGPPSESLVARGSVRISAGSRKGFRKDRGKGCSLRVSRHPPRGVALETS